jgi:hypothetical protein
MYNYFFNVTAMLLTRSPEVGEKKKKWTRRVGV